MQKGSTGVRCRKPFVIVIRSSSHVCRLTFRRVIVEGSLRFAPGCCSCCVGYRCSISLQKGSPLRRLLSSSHGMFCHVHLQSPLSRPVPPESPHSRLHPFLAGHPSSSETQASYLGGAAWKRRRSQALSLFPYPSSTSTSDPRKFGGFF